MNWTGVERRIKKKVLYYDDDQDSLDIFRITANAHGFDTTTVRYSSDFIKEFETGKYYAAFIDFVLSFSDGVCISRLIHKDKAPLTKLYIYTAYDTHLVTEKVNGDKITVLSKSDGIEKALAEVVNERG